MKYVPSAVIGTAISGLIAFASPAVQAQDIRLDFERLPNFTEVLDSYAGLHFTPGAYAFTSRLLGGSGSFYGGAPDSATSALILDGTSDRADRQQHLRVDVADGFAGFFSLSVAFLPGTTLSLQAFGANNELLASTSASNFNASSGCTPPGYVCKWTTVRLDLPADTLAYRLELFAPSGAGWMDDLRFGSASVVPEPSSALLGLVGLGALKLRRRQLAQG
jgi:hypothetical protein